MTLAQALTLNGILFALLCAAIGYLWTDFTHRVEARLDELEDSWKASSQAALDTRVKRLENDYFLLHEWKRVMFPRELEKACEGLIALYDRLEKDVKERIARIECDRK